MITANTDSPMIKSGGIHENMHYSKLYFLFWQRVMTILSLSNTLLYFGKVNFILITYN